MALSGGLDSALAAYLLREKGLEVWGVHLLLEEHAVPPPGLEELAAGLGLDLEILDLRREFAHQVVEYFVRQYFRGRTPNPCVRCNAAIKFGMLWERVKARGATHLATGHYVNLLPGPDGFPELHRGVDRLKDQSYFLCRLPRELLPHLLFPLGGMTKTEVKVRFRELGLPPPAGGRESQDVCFIPHGRYPEFLRTLQGDGRPGDLVDRRGRVLGRHPGVEHFTVGQRRGLGVPAGEPYYVLEIEPEWGRVVIGPRRELYTRGLWAREGSWLLAPPQGDLTATAVLRYRHPGVTALIRSLAAGALEVTFATPQTAVTPGQAVAFYQGERLLGGAWIEGKID